MDQPVESAKDAVDTAVDTATEPDAQRIVDAIFAQLAKRY